MPQGKGKASSSRRRSSDGHPYDDRPRLPHVSSKNMSPDMPHPISVPSDSSYLDNSIPFNLPPRRSMKMLKDGSDFVWPDDAHSLFVRGLQAWKFINLGSKRTRAPRGEGKTDFLVRYLQTHGVERTKKQVASHLQVLRTEWRNLDNPVLLSLVDETVSHTRSLSEPSLPPPTTSSGSSPSTSLSVFNPSPEPSDDRAISTPALPSPISTVSPPTSSSLFHPAHNIYGARSHSFPVTMSDDAFRAQSSANLGPWQLDTTVWNTTIDRLPAQQTEPLPRSPSRYRVASYDPPAPFQDYEHTPRTTDQSLQDSRRFSSDYYGAPGLSSRGEPSPSIAPLSRDSRSLSFEVDTPSTRVLTPYVPASPYVSYNNPSSYPIPSQSTQHDGYGNASISYGMEPYQQQFSPGGQPQQANPPHVLGIAGSASYDVVEPDFHHGAQPQVQPQWVRPPATFPHAPNTPE